MPEPTDHRAEAIAALTEAEKIAIDRASTDAESITFALIGIGRALLAGLPAPYDTRWGPEVVLTKEQSDAIHAILNSPPPDPPLSQHETTISVPNYLVSHEDGKQALYEELRRQGLHPPLSPSEG